MMLEPLLKRPSGHHERQQAGARDDAWSRWMTNGGTWWSANSGHHDAASVERTTPHDEFPLGAVGNPISIPFLSIV